MGSSKAIRVFQATICLALVIFGKGEKITQNVDCGKVDLQMRIVMPNGLVCGGSIINNLYVVTAATCINREYISRFGVNLKIELSSHAAGDNLQIRTIKSIHVVNDRVVNGTDSDTLDNNIVLIRLDAELEFNNAVRPVCLPPRDFQVNAGTTCYSTGKKMTPSGRYSTVKEVAVEITDSCQNEQFNPRTMVCADVYNRNEVDCAINSGGPLLCQVDKKWYLIGVISFTDSYVGSRGHCEGNEKIPTIYQKVSAYVQWIEDVIKTEK